VQPSAKPTAKPTTQNPTSRPTSNPTTFVPFTVAKVAISQALTGVTVEGFSTPSSIAAFESSVAVTLGGDYTPEDVAVTNVTATARRRLLRTEVFGIQASGVNVGYAITVRSDGITTASLDDTVNALSSTLNAAIASGNFTKTLVSQAAVHNSSSLATVTADTVPTYSAPVIEFQVTAHPSSLPTGQPTGAPNKAPTPNVLSTGAIVGIVIAVLVVAIGTGIGVYFWFFHQTSVETRNSFMDWTERGADSVNVTRPNVNTGGAAGGRSTMGGSGGAAAAAPVAGSSRKYVSTSENVSYENPGLTRKGTSTPKARESSAEQSMYSGENPVAAGRRPAASRESSVESEEGMAGTSGKKLPTPRKAKIVEGKQTSSDFFTGPPSVSGNSFSASAGAEQSKRKTMFDSLKEVLGSPSESAASSSSSAAVAEPRSPTSAARKAGDTKNKDLVSGSNPIAQQKKLGGSLASEASRAAAVRIARMAKPTDGAEESTESSPRAAQPKTKAFFDSPVEQPKAAEKKAPSATGAAEGENPMRRAKKAVKVTTAAEKTGSTSAPITPSAEKKLMPTPRSRAAAKGAFTPTSSSSTPATDSEERSSVTASSAVGKNFVVSPSTSPRMPGSGRQSSAQPSPSSSSSAAAGGATFMEEEGTGGMSRGGSAKDTVEGANPMRRKPKPPAGNSNSGNA
jgi:hypothetical protein